MFLKITCNLKILFNFIYFCPNWACKHTGVLSGGMEILNIYSWIFLDPLNFTNIYALLL